MAKSISAEKARTQRLKAGAKLIKERAKLLKQESQKVKEARSAERARAEGLKAIAKLTNKKTQRLKARAKLANEKTKRLKVEAKLVNEKAKLLKQESKKVKEAQGEEKEKTQGLKAEAKLINERAKLLKQESNKFKEAQKLRKKIPKRLKGTKQPRFSTAVTKLVSALLPQRSLSGSTSSSSDYDDGRGRGRPAGTFKARYLPDGRIVKVPTHIYKKMLSEVKAKQRLAEARRQAAIQQQIEANQIANSQDPRFAGAGQDEMFLEEPDMAHEQRVEQIRQQQLLQLQYQQMQQQERPTLGSRLRDIIRGNRPQQYPQQYPQQFPPLPKQQYPQQFQQRQSLFPQRELFQSPGSSVDPYLHRPRNPQVSIVSDRSTILNAPNTFARRNENPIGFRR